MTAPQGISDIPVPDQVTQRQTTTYPSYSHEVMAVADQMRATTENLVASPPEHSNLPTGFQQLLNSALAAYPELAEVVENWHRIPPEAGAAILVLVKTASLAYGI